MSIEKFDSNTKAWTLITTGISLMLMLMTYIYSDLVTLLYHVFAAIIQIYGIMCIQTGSNLGIILLACYHFVNFSVQTALFAYNLQPQQLDAIRQDCIAGGYPENCAGFLIPTNIAIFSVILTFLLLVTLISARFAYLHAKNPDLFAVDDLYDFPDETASVDTLPVYQPKETPAPMYTENPEIVIPPPAVVEPLEPESNPEIATNTK